MHVTYLTNIYRTLSYGQVLCWPRDTSGKQNDTATDTGLIQLHEHL